MFLIGLASRCEKLHNFAAGAVYYIYIYCFGLDKMALKLTK